MSRFARPTRLYSAISRIVSMDSCLAGSMKLHVLTTRTSAWSVCGVSSWPRATSCPIITSLSTRFLGQPRLMKPTFKRVYRPYGRISIQDSIEGSGKRLLWRAAGFEIQHSFFQDGHADVDVRLGALDGVEAGEVAAGEGLQACEDFGLHVAHDFGEAVDDSLFGGGEGFSGSLLGRGDGGREFPQSRWPVFGCHRCVVSHGVASPV